MIKGAVLYGYAPKTLKLGVNVIKLQKLVTFKPFTPNPLKYTLIFIQSSR